MSSILTYAHDKEKNLLYIDDVKNGYKCNCFCPHCGEPLNARNGGKERDHHFAHAQGHNCEGAYESMLHLLAKEILIETGGIMLPETSPFGFPTGFVTLINVEAEKWDNENQIKPDILAELPSGEKLYIEFYVTHKVNGHKRELILEKGLKCIEIDVHWQEGTKASLRKFLTESMDFRKWIQPEQKVIKNGDSSYYYGGYARPKVHEDTINYIKEQFDNDTWHIDPFNEDRNFDLKELGYDVCEVHSTFRRFKSDLLLYRSKKDGEAKAYISINIRSKRRCKERPLPPGFRIIDIIIKSEGDLNLLKNANSYWTQIDYCGAWEHK